MGEVIIHTDGACSPNPGRGGWAAILQFRKKGKIIAKREIFGGLPQSTNNRAEMTAVLKPLQILTRPSTIIVYTDSQYVANGIGRWVHGEPVNPHGWMVKWEKLGWRRKEGELLNTDLWKELFEIVHCHKSITMRYVRGHNGDVLNERCDTLAVEARLAITN